MFVYGSTDDDGDNDDDDYDDYDDDVGQNSARIVEIMIMIDKRTYE